MPLAGGVFLRKILSCLLLSLLWQVWGDGCYFEPFGLPGSKLEGIKAAFVDLLVRGRDPGASSA